MVIFSSISFLQVAMNYIDMFIIVLMVYAVFRGYTRGFIMQLTLLVALAFGIFAALKLAGFTARQLEGRISLNSENLYLVSVGITFVLAFIGINLAGKIFEKIAESAELSLPNRMLGILFSLCKIILLFGILLAYVDRVDQKAHFLPENSREHSLFYKPFTSIARAIFPSLEAPASSDKSIEEYVRVNRGIK